MTTHAELIETLADNKVYGYYSKNDPQVFELLGEAELDFEQWQFDIVGVFRHKETGLLFYGHDSGCSCPTPWENTKVTDLTPLETYQEWLDYMAEAVGQTPEELREQERREAGSVQSWEIREAETKRPKLVDGLEVLRVEVEQAFKDLKRKEVLDAFVADNKPLLDRLD